jgi:hypothetical protein
MTQRQYSLLFSFSAVTFVTLAIAPSPAIAVSPAILLSQTEPTESEDSTELEVETPEDSTELEVETPEDSTELEGEAPEVVEDEWEEFTYRSGGFRVSFPATPVEDRVSANPELGIPESGAVLLDTEGNTVGYGAMYRDYANAPSLENAAAIETFFNEFRDDFVANGVLDGQFLREREIAIAQYPGREMEIMGSEGFLKTRVYLVNDRLYLLVTVSMTEETYPETGDRFLDSFELLD